MKKKRKPKTTKCKECGKEFSMAKWRVGKAKYCSYQCSNKGRTTPKAYNKPRICKECGIEFLPTQWNQKYCGRACFIKSVTRIGVVKCKECGKEFQQTRMKQKYCSRECSRPYKNKKLKRPKNQNADNIWSKEVKERAGNKCEYCGKENGLNSHHIYSRSNRSVRWDLDNGICVCVSHHIFGLFSAHKSPIEFVEWLKEKRGIEWYEKLRAKARTIAK